MENRHIDKDKEQLEKELLEKDFSYFFNVSNLSDRK